MGWNVENKHFQWVLLLLPSSQILPYSVIIR